MKHRAIGIAALLIVLAGLGFFWLYQPNGQAAAMLRSANESEPAVESTAAPATEPPTEAPTEPPPVITWERAEPDPGLEAVEMKLSGKRYVSSDHKTVYLKVKFSGEEGFLPPGGESCTLECWRSGFLFDRIENVDPLPGTEYKFRKMPFRLTRYMNTDPIPVTVVLRCGEKSRIIETEIEIRNDPDEVYAAASGDPRPYSIDILRNENVVVVYGKDSGGSYTMPVKVFVCSTGSATPRGNYSLGWKTPWRALFGGVWGQYTCHITGNILFHSVPYYSRSKGNLETAEYNKLGTKASMGCIRLAVKDAKWIYDFCPVGSPIHIYDVSELPVEKPTPIHIDPSDPRAGWDPTDPDPNNPWHTND